MSLGINSVMFTKKPGKFLMGSLQILLVKPKEKYRYINILNGKPIKATCHTDLGD